MSQNLKSLLEKVSADEALAAKFEPITKMEDRAAATEAVLALAAEAGMPLAAADLEPDGELDLDELGAVSGGACTAIGSGYASEEEPAAPAATTPTAPPGLMWYKGKLIQKPDRVFGMPS